VGPPDLAGLDYPPHLHSLARLPAPRSHGLAVARWLAPLAGVNLSSDETTTKPHAAGTTHLLPGKRSKTAPNIVKKSSRIEAKVAPVTEIGGVVKIRYLRGASAASPPSRTGPVPGREQGGLGSSHRSPGLLRYTGGVREGCGDASGTRAVQFEVSTPAKGISESFEVSQRNYWLESGSKSGQRDSIQRGSLSTNMKNHLGDNTRRKHHMHR